MGLGSQRGSDLTSSVIFAIYPACLPPCAKYFVQSGRQGADPLAGTWLPPPSDRLTKPAKTLQDVASGASRLELSQIAVAQANAAKTSPLLSPSVSDIRLAGLWDDSFISLFGRTLPRE